MGPSGGTATAADQFALHKKIDTTPGGPAEGSHPVQSQGDMRLLRLSESWIAVKPRPYCNIYAILKMTRRRRSRVLSMFVQWAIPLLRFLKSLDKALSTTLCFRRKSADALQRSC